MPSQRRASPFVHMCYDCGRTFKHNKGLVMHRVRARNHRSEHAARICTEWCPVCLKFFHEVRRVVHHVSLDAPRCGAL
eukprot:9751640-Alexandrium_andersonii.AAC.1